MFDKSAYVRDRYLRILELSFQVINALDEKVMERRRSSGLIVIDDRWPQCQRLAIKVFHHAVTIYQLLQGSKAPVGGEIEIFDHASSRILARSVLEAYVEMFQIFFEPTTDDLLEYRYACWRLDNALLRKKNLEELIDIDPDQQTRYRRDITELQQEVRELRKRIEETGTFASLTLKQQKQSLQGRRMPTREILEIYRKAGLAGILTKLKYLYSADVHPDVWGLGRIFDAATPQEEIDRIEGTMHIVAILLAKLTLHYAETFPEAKDVCEAHADSFSLAQSLTKAARLGE
jgi:hypothetical protein